MKIIHPSALRGAMRVQPSKSALHRLLVCAALAGGESSIHNFALSADIRATVNALRDMGFCEYEVAGETCIVRGGLRRESKPVIDCGESGSTLRFLIPLAFDGQRRLFTGDGRLMERPMGPYEDMFAAMGYAKKQDGIEICGKLPPGIYELLGDVSSQFLSGLLFALPLLSVDSQVRLRSALESESYVDLTRQIQSLFGVGSDRSGDVFSIRGGQAYSPTGVSAEGDYSHAAFFAAAAAMGGDIAFSGLARESLQGDKAIFDILRVMGSEVWWEENALHVRCAALKPVDLDVSNIPDLVPVLAVLACAVQGKTRITGARRLRFKESDRLHAMTTELEKLGADIVEYEDSLTVNGTGSLRGGAAHTHGDHRVAMALAMASCIAKGDIVLDAPEVTGKSAPRFFEEFALLGGKQS